MKTRHPLLFILPLLLWASPFHADAQVRSRTSADALPLTEIAPEEDLPKLQTKPKRNRIGVRMGYAFFKPELAKHGYTFGGDYAYYIVKRFFVEADYFYGFSDNKEQIEGSDQYMRGGIRRHMITVGLGYDVLSKNGHTLFVSGTAGAGYNRYKRDLLVKANPIEIQNVTTKGWSGAYSVSAGYQYDVASFFAVGLNYGAYFVSPDWAHTINLRLNYKF